MMMMMMEDANPCWVGDASLAIPETDGSLQNWC
jgi:hypothetical protein